MKRISASAPVIEGKQYHIACGPKDVSKYVLLPGDPERVGKIASLWDSQKEVAHHREYHTMTGVYQNVPITCTSTGIGAPSLAIAVEELTRIGVTTFIRTGTCGGIQKNMNIGDLVISTGAVRFEHASQEYVTQAYPAVAHYEVVEALIQSAKELKVRYHVGITASMDTFYCGQGRPGYKNYLPSFDEHILSDMQKAGVKNFEMEVSCLLTLAGLFGKRAGAVCVVIASRITDELVITDEMQKKVGLVASRAVAILASK